MELFSFENKPGITQVLLFSLARIFKKTNTTETDHFFKHFVLNREKLCRVHNHNKYKFLTLSTGLYNLNLFFIMEIKECVCAVIH